VIELDPKAWDEGFQAGAQGQPACPYRAGTAEAFAWRSGYIEGAAGKREGLTPLINPSLAFVVSVTGSRAGVTAASLKSA
jgi:hypothetical protein